VSHFLSGFQFLSFDAGIGETGERFMFSESTGVHRLLIAKGLRAFGDGYVSLLLPLYLVELGLRPFQVGIIATITLIGSGLLSLAVGLHAWRFHYRSLLLVASALMAGTGFGFFVFTSFWPLMVVALVGTLNPSNGDVSVFLPLEHSVLAKLIGDRQRTAVFARYSLMGALLGATGSLASALPPAIAGVTGMVSANVIRLMFIFYALIAGAAGLIYRGLPKTLSAAAPQQKAPLHESKRMVYTLAALFSLDAFGGGFVVQSMLALWLHQRFDTSMATAGVVFFLDGSTHRCVISCRGADCRTLWTAQYHGVHAHPVERLPDPAAFRAFFRLRHCSSFSEERPIANGRTDENFLRDGHRDSRGTASRGKYYVGAAQPCRGNQSVSFGIPAGYVDIWLASYRGRRGEGRLRHAAFSEVQEDSPSRREKLTSGNLSSRAVIATGFVPAFRAL
jgi:MFS family permease